MSAIKEHQPRGHIPPGQDGGRGPPVSNPGGQVSVPNTPAPAPAPAPAPQVELPSDDFSIPVSYDSPEADTGLRGQAPGLKRSVSDLTPDLRQIRDLPDVSNRFAADYQMVAREVVDVPNAETAEKAQRTFEYFTKYAERFVELANKPKVEEQKPADPELKLTPEEEALIARLPENLLPKELQEKLHRMREAGLLPEGKPAPLPEDPQSPGKSRLDRLQQQQQPGEKQDLWRMLEGKRLEEPGAMRRPGTPEGERKTAAQAFVETLSHLSFEQLKDQSTGQNGLERAYELLMSRSLKELQQKAEQTKMNAQQWPPPGQQPRSEELVREQAPKKMAANEFTGAPLQYKDIGESPMKLSHRQAQDPLKDGVELRVNTLAAEAAKGVIQPRDQQELRQDSLGNEVDPRQRRSNGKLGANMLWNVLHKFRGEGEDSTLEQAKWDRMTFGAMIFLVLVTLAAVALISL